MKKILFVIIATLFLVYFVMAQGSDPNKVAREAASNKWTGFYYPDKDKIEDKSTWIKSGYLNTLEECQAWVNSIHKPENTKYDYQCGFECYHRAEIPNEDVICKTDTR